MPQQPKVDAIKVLADLTTDISDVISGYEEMEKRAQPELHPIIQRLRTLHKTHAQALEDAIARSGGDPADVGSAMAAVHVAVATARDWFGALDESAIPQIVSGEKRLIESYDTALDALPKPHEHAALVQDQREVLSSHIKAIEFG